MKKLLLIVSCLVSLSAAAQNQVTLETATVGGEKTVILPTYDNLLKLSGIDSVQMEGFLKNYGYEQEPTAGNFSSAGDNFGVDKRSKQVVIMFEIKTDHFSTLRDDIRKRFPNALITTKNASGQTTDTYIITWSDAKGQHVRQLVTTEDNMSGSVSFTVLK